MPGVALRPDLIVPELEAAAADGWVLESTVRLVTDGLRHGFTAGVDLHSPALRGRRRFRTYPSALAHRPEVSKGLRKRVLAGKTLCLGPYLHARDKHLLPPNSTIFPLGAVPKASQDPGDGVEEWRPISDHTRSRFNESSDVSALRHSITVYRDIERYHHSGAVMRVSDVDSAFPTLPWHPDLWRHLLFEWWDLDAADHADDAAWCLFVHLCGDFGAAGMPGVWHVFFELGMIPTARHQHVLTSPMATCVDDTALIGPAGAEGQIDAEGRAFTAWLEERGVYSKVAKVRAAASLQRCVGFWWDSLSHARTLEELKLAHYVKCLHQAAARRSHSLSEMQSLSGQMQRGIMTLPPGAACLLANLFALMRGLLLPWQKRRSSAALRTDFTTVATLLELNEGKGYYRFDNFTRLPQVETDASKSSSYVGGGYFSYCGRYRYWIYGASASRRPIDWLEGDSVLVAMEDVFEGKRKCIALFRIDNRAFQRSAVKGWSRAERLSLLLKQVFQVSVQCECIPEYEWLSTDVNIFADALSRPNGHSLFLQRVREYDPLPPGATLRPHPQCAMVRRFGRAFASDEDGDGPPCGRGVLVWCACLLLRLSVCGAARGGSHARGVGVAATVAYVRTSVYTGLPVELASQVDELLDNRLSTSSMRSVTAALSHWDVVRARHGWGRILRSDLPERGGRMMTFLLYLLYDTTLAADSISNYVWAFRAWHKLQRQVDPIGGIAEWEDVMSSVAVVAWVVSEPRKRVPIELIYSALRRIDHSVFWEVQIAVFVLLLLYSFLRSESPCPKNYSGEDSFDADKQLQVRDVLVESVPRLHARVRVKIIKQDQRLERPAARAEGGDFVEIGAVSADPEACFLVWLRRLFALHGGRRPDHAPFFVARDRVRPLRARDALTDLRTVLARVCGETQANTYGCHGCRVEGYDKTRRVNKPLAIAQGGWDPEAGSNERYDRFSQSEVHDIPSDIYRQLQADASPLQAVSADSDVAVPSPDAPQEPAERQLVRRPPADGRGRLGSARRPAPAPYIPQNVHSDLCNT